MGIEYCREILQRIKGRTVAAVDLLPPDPKDDHPSVHRNERLIFDLTDGSRLELEIGSNVCSIKTVQPNRLNLSFVPLLHEESK